MAYVRFGDGCDSDVYIYDDYRYGLFCCWCSITKARTAPHGFVAGEDYDLMLRHIAEHRAAGDTVPTYVDEDLIAERDEVPA